MGGSERKGNAPMGQIQTVVRYGRYGVGSPQDASDVPAQSGSPARQSVELRFGKSQDEVALRLLSRQESCRDQPHRCIARTNCRGHKRPDPADPPPAGSLSMSYAVDGRRHLVGDRLDEPGQEPRLPRAQLDASDVADWMIRRIFRS